MIYKVALDFLKINVAKGMKLLYRIAFLSVLFNLFYLSNDLLAQSKSMKDIDRRSSKKERLLNKSESKKVRGSKKKAENQKEQQKEKYDKAKTDDNERRVDLQTPKTKERMKDTRKKADEFNNQGREPFFKRLFKRKKPKS